MAFDRKQKPVDFSHTLENDWESYYKSDDYRGLLNVMWHKGLEEVTAKRIIKRAFESGWNIKANPLY